MAYSFTSASNQYLSASSAAASAMPLTMAAWAYPTTTGTARVIIALDSSAGFSAFLLALSASNQVFTNASAGTGNFVTSANAVNTNAWCHACGVFSSTASREVFTDGASTATSTSSFTAPSPNGTKVGARLQNGVIGSQYTGFIAEVGIWSAALTASEVAALARGVSCDQVRPQSLVFYAPLIRNIADMARGITLTNNNTATVANHPRVYA